jgi:uncharacterized protein YqiB (DUF1249 family)
MLVQQNLANNRITKDLKSFLASNISFQYKLIENTDLTTVHTCNLEQSLYNTDLSVVRTLVAVSHIPHVRFQGRIIHRARLTDNAKY